MPLHSIVRDGFEFSHGRFRVQRGDIELVSPSSLRDMFIPRISASAAKIVKEQPYFVAGQLQHYDVAYSPRELTGNGATLMKKLIQEGKLDKVPKHIERLRSQMSKEWYKQLTLEEMAEHLPEYIFKKYFLDVSGRPAPKKKTKVLVVPIPGNSASVRRKVLEEADKVAGLRYEISTMSGSVYLGWDETAVRKARDDFDEEMKREMKREREELEARQEKREAERSKMHADYLLREAGRAKGGKNSWSVAGEYIIDCDTIEGEWPDQSEDMSLTVSETETPGIFRADFDFGVVEGIMILSSQEAALERYCDGLDRKGLRSSNRYGYSEDDSDDDSDDDEDEDEDEDEDQQSAAATGSKRKAVHGRGPPSKKTKGSTKQPLKWFLRWRGRETDEGEEILYNNDEKGTIQFDNSEFASFKGGINIDFVDEHVAFTGRKVSGPSGRKSSDTAQVWAGYTEVANKLARYRRW